MISIPNGYLLLEPKPGLRIMVREGLEAAVSSCGLDRFPETGSEGGRPAPAGGRSPVSRVTIDQGPPLVIKTYRRGGLLGRLWCDIYASGNARPINEVRVCAAAAGSGLRVPLIQILWIEKVSSFGNRLAAATREIPGAESVFQELCRLNGQGTKRQRLLVAIAGAIRSLHEAGIHHPDLNLGNILVSRANGEAEIHVIDFDRATLRDGPLSRGKRNSTLARMYRSLVKLSRPDPPALTAGEKELFLSAYWRGGTTADSALCRRCRRELTLHRLWWRVSSSTRNR